MRCMLGLEIGAVHPACRGEHQESAGRSKGLGMGGGGQAKLGMQYHQMMMPWEGCNNQLEYTLTNHEKLLEAYGGLLASAASLHGRDNGALLLFCSLFYFRQKKTRMTLPHSERGRASAVTPEPTLPFQRLRLTRERKRNRSTKVKKNVKK